MGSVYSSISVLSVVLITGGIVYGFLEKRPPPPDWAAPSNRAVLPGEAQPAPAESKGKKKRKAAAKEGGVQSASQTEVEPTVVQFPAVVPGGFDLAAEQTPATAATSKPKKKKKAKKASSSAAQAALDAQSDSSATAPESSTPVPRPTAARRKSTPIIDADGPWTRVESKKRGANPPGAAAASSATAEPATSEVTTSVTGTSSPVAERTEDEQVGTAAARRTLAERLLPKPRKTHVEDMLETPDVPAPARVLRVQPRPDEQPAAGFSWADYEDVDNSGLTADDADGEDESGWIVQSSRGGGRTRPKAPHATQSAPESLTKKQRQNLARNEAAKAAKAEAEAQRQATLAQHKRELEKTRMAEQYAQGKKSGGMRATVDTKGHMVFE
ncbi:hypothetical protein PsYK624_064310 [Phanerochaete sordida]|uniref:Uncharacterized protein n=1 Tax=Phanerochaete sordida TaxID=48140 RepID=A0A9P3G921_9APHY|nr:hypothetical protein PsYK624_064310 [Phanerochaete sordida]